MSGIVFLLVMLPFTFIQFFYAPWLEMQNRARAPRSLPAGMRGHVVLTHFNNVAANLIARLDHLGITSVVLVSDLPRALELFDRGFRVMVGDINHPDTYRNLRVQEAAMVVVLNDDLTSTNIIHTIRETGDSVVTVTNADHDDSLDVVEKRPALGQGNERVITGSAADHETLIEAGIESTPSIILTTHEDDLNVYLTIYCRRLRPDAQIISRASLNRNVNTLRRAGANLVMSYSSITTATIVNLLRPGSLLMLSESLNVFTACVDGQQRGRSLLQLRIRERRRDAA